MRYSYSVSLLLTLSAILTGFLGYSQENRLIITSSDTVYFDVQSDAEEVSILKELYEATGGVKWKRKTNWLTGATSKDFATWYGVVVENGDVVEIHLDNNNLTGTLPSSVYKLLRLRSASFAGNAFTSTTSARQASSTMMMSEATAPAYSGPMPVVSGKNLPVWGLAVNGPKLQSVDWRIYPPTVSDLVNSGTSLLGSPSVAIDYCGRLAFYALHSGTDAPNQLHIYDSDGNRLTNGTAGDNLQALSSANGNTEIQVIPVPMTTDEWYIIYSKYKTPCNPSASTYCPATVVYARVRYNADTRALSFLPGMREVEIRSGYTFIQGKAVSKDVDGDASKHYLYLAQRQSSGVDKDYTYIHRFLIDEHGITIKDVSQRIAAKFWESTQGGIGWSPTISGSSIELSQDGKTLAVSNRNVGVGITQDFIIYDTEQFSSPEYVPVTISIPDLIVYNTGKSVRELYASGGPYPCFIYLKNKVSIIEFSPSGRYLYAVHGGYPDNSGGQTYNTYLLQIDLKSSTEGKYTMRMLTQMGINAASSGTCLGGASGGANDHAIEQIGSAYDGRLYFTKRNQPYLFVIPNPDDPMPHSLTPAEVNLAKPGVHNILMNSSASVMFMPESMDGYEYLKESSVDKFILNKSSVGVNSSLNLTLLDFNSSNVYQIAWGDGSLETLTASTKSHSYAETGDYKITLTITQPDKCAYKFSKSVEVVPCEAVEDINIQSVTYNCAVKFKTRKLTNCLASYTWNFGDGTTSLERNPIHAYGAPGSYTVSVTVNYDCSGCQGSKTATTTVNFSPTDPVIEEEIIQVKTDQKLEVISSQASSFSEAWTLDHVNTAWDEKGSFTNGSQGVWRNNASFVYEKDRKLSPATDIAKDGTYTLEQFNWEYAEYNAVPNWIKANAITRYSPYSYELENQDVLGTYSAAIYDYSGHLPAATGTNMRQDEMAFTGFEVVDGSIAGNWTVKNTSLPAYTLYTIRAGKSHMAVVEATVEQLQNVTLVDVIADKTYWFGIRNAKTYIKQNEVICLKTHPQNPAWSVIVLKTAPYDGIWSGKLRIKNIVTPAVACVVDNANYHTGKSSMKVVAAQTFKQELLHLDPGKVYWVNGWVSIGRPSVTTPVLASGLGIDIIAKQKSGVVISTFTINAAGTVIEGWQQFKGSFTCPANTAYIEVKFKAAGSLPAWYDDLRIQPEGGNMKGYIYDVTDYRLRAVLDEENFASLFYYDKEGNLSITKKETKDGIKTLSENVSYQVERP
jgi:PKD repeat protein